MTPKGQQSVLVSSARTPIGSFQGKLADFSAPELGAMVLREALKRISLAPEELDEVIMGCVISGGVGQAPARQAVKAAGFPNRVGALTINKVCGSSLKAVALADQMIRSGDAKVIASGGMESMTNAPYYLFKARSGLRLGNSQLVDGMIHDGLWDPYNNFHMGNAGDLCARKQDISREDQDAYAKRSYERTLESMKQGLFKREIVAVELKKSGGDTELFDEDEEPKRGMQKLAKMSGLKPAFDPQGTVTAANASKLSDGAAAVVVMSPEKAKSLGIKARFRIVGHVHAALAPEDFPIAPVAALRLLSDRTGVKLSQIDRFEINEAFSVVAETCMRQLELDPKRVNVRGGAVALGHPIGASGARILITLMHQLEDDQLGLGVATLCIGGGEAIALLVERV